MGDARGERCPRCEGVRPFFCRWYTTKSQSCLSHWVACDHPFHDGQGGGGDHAGVKGAACKPGDDNRDSKVADKLPTAPAEADLAKRRSRYVNVGKEVDEPAEADLDACCKGAEHWISVLVHGEPFYPEARQAIIKILRQLVAAVRDLREDLKHEQTGAEELFCAAGFRRDECRTHDTLMHRILDLRQRALVGKGEKRHGPTCDGECSHETGCDNVRQILGGKGEK